jgi:hypothetical protein
MRFQCENCGDVDEVTFDGYHFAERLLEGVKFRAKLIDGEVQISYPEDAYTKKLNMKELVKDAKAFVEETDEVTCAKCQAPCGVIQTS